MSAYVDDDSERRRSTEGEEGDADGSGACGRRLGGGEGQAQALFDGSRLKVQRPHVHLRRPAASQVHRHAPAPARPSVVLAAPLQSELVL